MFSYSYFSQIKLVWCRSRIIFFLSSIRHNVRMFYPFSWDLTSHISYLHLSLESHGSLVNQDCRTYLPLNWKRKKKGEIQRNSSLLGLQEKYLLGISKSYSSSRRTRAKFTSFARRKRKIIGDKQSIKEIWSDLGLGRTSKLQLQRQHDMDLWFQADSGLLNETGTQEVLDPKNLEEQLSLTF